MTTEKSLEEILSSKIKYLTGKIANLWKELEGTDLTEMDTCVYLTDTISEEETKLDILKEVMKEYEGAKKE